jgi:D-alanyl-D-alanine carboxypeptidase
MASNLQQKLRATLASLGVDASIIERRGLPLFDDATKLIVIGRGKDGKEHQLEPRAAAHWLKLDCAAMDDGVSMYILSAYRGFQRQSEIVRAALAAGRSVDSVFANIAPPGCSEHHTGRAVDLGTVGCENLTEAFEQTAAFEWLQQRGCEFGFGLSFPLNNPWGYNYEPWHWCFDPQF